MGSSTVMFTVRMWIPISPPEITRKGVLFEDQNLLEGSSKSFFACMPGIAGYIAGSCSLEHKNCPISEVYRLTSTNSWQVGKKAL